MILDWMTVLNKSEDRYGSERKNIRSGSGEHYLSKDENCNKNAIFIVGSSNKIKNPVITRSHWL